MSIPFSNTTQRIPKGFANLLEGLAREVLRNQPADIPSFAAKYFETLLIEREKTGYDPSEWGAKLEDRYYNNRAFKELAPTGEAGQAEDKKQESAQLGEEAKASDSSEESVKLTDLQAAIIIQASYRGYRSRKQSKIQKGDIAKKEEPTEPEKIEQEKPQ